MTAAKPPVEVLDLAKCATGLVNLAERSICARPRTLLLEIYKETGLYRIVTKHFLSVDTMGEMKIWQQKLNAIVLSLRNWGETQIGCYNKCSEIYVFIFFRKYLTGFFSVCGFFLITNDVHARDNNIPQN